MKDPQILSLMIASLPTMLTVLIGILINNARLSDLRAHMDARFADVDKRFADVDRRFNEVDRRFEQVDRRFDQVDRRFDQVDRRFEETKELWRSELHRVEQVLDARLKHIEQD
jgi:chromosome segregation ATPase